MVPVDVFQSVSALLCFERGGKKKEQVSRLSCGIVARMVCLWFCLASCGYQAGGAEHKHARRSEGEALTGGAGSWQTQLIWSDGPVLLRLRIANSAGVPENRAP